MTRHEHTTGDADDTDADSTTDRPDDAEAGKPVEILLAEDNPNDVTLTRKAFENGRILNNLHVVDDGVKALSFLRQEGKYEDAPRPDIMLLDLEMPRMDGREVLREMEDDQALASIPVIVLTSSEAEQDIVDSYEHSANAYLTKPVGYDEFQGIIRQIEAFWFEIVRLPSGE